MEITIQSFIISGGPNSVLEVPKIHKNTHVQYFSVLTFAAILCWKCEWWNRALCIGRKHRVHTHWAAQVFDDLRIGTGCAACAKLEQAGYAGGGISLDQCVLLLLNGLHKGAHQWVELLWQCCQAYYSTGCKSMYTQMHLLPLSTGLSHCRTRLLPLTVQGLQLPRLQVQRCCGLSKDAGHLMKRWDQLQKMYYMNENCF